ncbi:transposase [Ramlibacter sp.]|uniref:transposase n=1 Tax=Ramlibacter sp. TaxID=1917967 RepID=UPI00262D85BA|nr:transposase [Ramlibacter sp.]
MNDSKRTRRRHGTELKAQVLGECAQPGASVASVAMSHGINANVVHKWRRLANAAAAAVMLEVATFAPLRRRPHPSCTLVRRRIDCC